MGQEEFKADYLQRKVTRAAPPLNTLAVLSPEASMQLVRYVYNHKADYIYKTMANTAQTSGIFDSFDDGIDEALLAIAGHTDPAELRRLRQLPLELGGLGLPTVGGDSGTRHRLITACRAWNFMEAHRKHLQGAFTQLYSTLEMTALYAECQAVQPPIIEEDEGMQEPAPMAVQLESEASGQPFHQAPANQTPKFLLYGSHLPDQPVEQRAAPLPFQIDVRSLKRRSKKAVFDKKTQEQQALIAALQSDPLRSIHAIQLRSQAHPSSGKLFAAPYRQTEHKTVEDSVYRGALRQHLLCDEFAVGGHPATEEEIRNGPHLYCKCQLETVNAQDIRVFTGHVYVCKQIGLKTHRHDEVRDILAAHLRKQFSADGRVTVELRPEEIGGVRNQWRPDIVLEARGVTKHIDILIVDPATQSYSHGEYSSSRVAGGAAIQGEQRKRNRYRDSPDVECLVPFVMESTGRFGPEAERFVREYGGSAASQAVLKKKLSIALTIWEGKRLGQMLKNLLTEDAYRIKRGLIEAARHPVQG
jgi:hypothetical protein